ncbi:hypothetical protein ACE7GA_27180 (plasmid) [Roseomonas sp. CCTCC AB2023176]|uniref:hypothetical protein n=1 Tax=Roseomonas sp. CCTCC AB2023176 TaxID=3342640 RepID=UPI0035E1B5F9
MTPSETPLEMVQRHVREGKGQVRRQRDLVQHLEAAQSPLTDEAGKLLAEFASLQGDHERHLAQIEREMQSGRRDADGNLLPLRPAKT